MVGVERHMCFLLFRAENKETRRRVSKFYTSRTSKYVCVSTQRPKKKIVNAYVV